MIGSTARISRLRSGLLSRLSMLRAASYSLALLALSVFPLAAGAADEALAAAPTQATAETLRARYTALEPKLRQNQFNRPMALESTESPNRVRGNVYAVVNHPFATVSTGLNNPAHWCEIFILHINTKYCHATTANGITTLAVYIGKKTPEPLANANRADFRYQVASVTPEFFDIRLSAREGPMGTSDYRVTLEAVSLPDNKTFLHLSYSYGYGFSGKLAMSTYFATAGSGKVGFSVGPRGEYVDGMRGLIERNTMRYYLAIDAYLASLGAPAGAQLDKRLQTWFNAVEEYPRQLHEMDRAEYVDMKRDEYQRQQTAQ